MGLVFVLLLGEIDLSAGWTAGVAAAIMGVAATRQGWPWWVAVLACLLTGAVIGTAIGLLVARLGIPSFVVTLAAFLGAARRAAQDHRRGRHDRDPRLEAARDQQQHAAGLARLGAVRRSSWRCTRWSRCAGPPPGGPAACSPRASRW